MSKIIFGVEYVIVNCCVCSMNFAVTKTWDNLKRANHRRFTCPDGHGQNYTGKSELEKAKTSLKHERKEANACRVRLSETIERRNEQLVDLNRSRASLRGQITKLKNKQVAIH